jgi:hypothetical protein
MRRKPNYSFVEDFQGDKVSATKVRAAAFGRGGCRRRTAAGSR